MITLAKRVDAHVGERVRNRRTELGLTQEDLALDLEISYQQVQKYETGANRVSAGRLYQIARKLGVEVAYFFKDLDESADAGPITPLGHGGGNRSTIEIARNFAQIRDPEIRSALNGLIKSLSRGGS
jgi:transcriptional regulator with XRE-family HTH domain